MAVLRQTRENSAQPEESGRWFVYTLAFLLPWAALVTGSPWLAIFLALACLAFWLWWIYPPVGVNRRPLTWLLTLGLLTGNALSLLLSLELFQGRS